MAFVYIGIAVVVIFLFLVLYYNRKTIINKLKDRKKKPKAEPVKEDPDTKVDEKNIDFNDFSQSQSQEYSSVDEFLNPSLDEEESLENLDFEEFSRLMNDRLKSSREEEEEEPEENGGMKNISIGRHSLNKENLSIMDDDYDDEMEDFDIGVENTSIASKFANLPDDMKALMIADILKKKYW